MKYSTCFSLIQQQNVSRWLNNLIIRAVVCHFYRVSSFKFKESDVWYKFLSSVNPTWVISILFTIKENAIGLFQIIIKLRIFLQITHSITFDWLRLCIECYSFRAYAIKSDYTGDTMWKNDYINCINIYRNCHISFCVSV